MESVKVVILSHKRAGRVTTHNHVAGALICVPAAQADAYAKYHPAEQLIVHPDTVIGLLAKRQWIISNLGDVFMLDDDSIGMYRIYRPSESPRGQICSPRRAYELIQHCADTARKLGAFLYGFASHAHPMTFRTFRPFRFGGYSPGGAMGVLSGSKLWWPTDDPSMPCDDYWICLLNAYYHRYAWYDGRFAFGFTETYVGQGGLAEFRIGDTERKGTEFLRRHFGDVVQPKKTSGTATKRTKNAWQRKIVMPYRV